MRHRSEPPQCFMCLYAPHPSSRFPTLGNRMCHCIQATVSQEEPDEPKKPEKPSMGLEIRFCKDERTKQRNVPVVTLVKPGGASDEVCLCGRVGHVKAVVHCNTFDGTWQLSN